jgi:hypothetical protein
LMCFPSYKHRNKKMIMQQTPSKLSAKNYEKKSKRFNSQIRLNVTASNTS